MKNTEMQKDIFLKRDADVEVNVSVVGSMICVSAKTRYGKPVKHMVRRPDAIKRLLEEVQSV